MPAYDYTCDKCGTTTERVFMIAERKAHVKCPICGGKADRDMGAELKGMMATPGCWSTPLLSDAAGVHPSQRKEAYDKSVADGVPTHFTNDGRAIFTSRGHRKKYLKTIGLHDRDGGYGD